MAEGDWWDTALDWGADTFLSGGSGGGTGLPPNGWPTKWANTNCPNAPDPERLRTAFINAPDGDIAEFIRRLRAGNPWMTFLSRQYLIDNYRAFATTIAGGNDCENKSELGREIEAYGNQLVAEYGFGSVTQVSDDTQSSIPPTSTGDTQSDLQTYLDRFGDAVIGKVEEIVGGQSSQETTQPQQQTAVLDDPASLAILGLGAFVLVKVIL